MSKVLKVFYIIMATVIILILLAPFLLIYLLNNGNPYEKFLVNKYIPTHLEKMGYKEKDIKKQNYVEPKHLINKDFYHGHYMVVFNDEPSITYYYGISKKGKNVKQFCEKDVLINGVIHGLSEITKHSETACVNSLDNR